MVDLSSINAKIKEIKRMNNSEKENPHDCPRHVNDYFGLRNLLHEVKQSLQQEVSYITYSYRNPFVPEGFSRNDIRNTYRKMINDAEKYVLEDMSIYSRDLLNIDNKDCMIEFNTKDCKLTISENVRGEDEWAGTHYEEIYSKQFDNTLDMLNAYFDIVDSDYQLVKDLVNNYIHCETREEVFDAYVEALEKAGWETHYITGVNFEYLELTCNTSTGDKFVCDIDCHDTSFDEKVSDIRDYLMDFDGKDDVRKMLENAVNITESAAKVYNELPEHKAKGKSYHDFEL